MMGSSPPTDSGGGQEVTSQGQSWSCHQHPHPSYTGCGVGTMPGCTGDQGALLPKKLWTLGTFALPLLELWG